MVFSRRLHRKLRLAIIIGLVLLLLSLTIYYLIHRRSDPSSQHVQAEATQLWRPLAQSQLLRIDGTQKSLGQASPIYIINLPSRLDRRIDSIAVAQKLDLQAVLVPAYSIDSPEISQLNHSYIHHFFFKSTELACWASHMRLWKTIAKNPYSQWTLIFEDDVDLELDIVNIMQSFPKTIWEEPDLIYLGHCANPPGPLIYQSIHSNHRVHRAGHPSCTHAYAIRSASMEKLIDLLSNPQRPIDDSIVNLVENEQLLAYSIHPPVAVQRAVSTSNPSDVNRSDRHSWKYRVQYSIYTFLQWWNGVEFYEGLNQSTLQRSDRTKANYWRQRNERGIWLHHPSAEWSLRQCSMNCLSKTFWYR